jgi:endonuclease/exonuclease/phosphatase family metal-dependent hydrolase
MRLATWNIWSGRSRGAERVDVEAYVAAVRALDADVLALQEVDRNQPRSQRLDLAAIAAEAMGADEWRFVPALVGTPDSWRAARDDEDVDAPAYGVALLSRHPIRDWRIVRLPGAPLRVPFRWPGQRLPTLVRDEQRVAIIAVVESPVGPVSVVATHLSFLPVWNGVQLRHLLGGLPDHPGSRVLLGDLNMGPARASRISGLEPLAVGPTYPSWSPARQIDHVMGSDGLVSISGGPVRVPVSDHCALVSQVQLARS